MKINGTIFTVDLMSILVELRSQLSANGVQRFGTLRDSGDDIMCSCPFHKGGQEHKPSMGIRKSDGVSNCLACGAKMGLDRLIANCFGYTDPAWGYHWLTKNFLTVGVSDREAIKINVGRVSFADKNSLLGYTDNLQSNVSVSEEELDTYRYTHEYMYKRGLTDTVIDLFDIGYDISQDSITFPVKDISGNCAFIARRAIKTKRFNIPKDIEKPLYGLYEAYNASSYGGYDTSRLYVCEGLFDCLRLWCNHKVAVAGFGCLFNELQIAQLKKMPYRQFVLALDNDEAGRAGAERIKKSVRNKLMNAVVIPKDKKDIGELTDDEIMNLQEIFA